MQDTRETASRSAAFNAGIALAAAALGWLLYRPLRDAAPVLDDFVFLALARHIDAPFALLVQDALGTYFFRPLVMFAWWLVLSTIFFKRPRNAVTTRLDRIYDVVEAHFRDMNELAANPPAKTIAEVVDR